MAKMEPSNIEMKKMECLRQWVEMQRGMRGQYKGDEDGEKLDRDSFNSANFKERLKYSHTAFGCKSWRKTQPSFSMQREFGAINEYRKSIHLCSEFCWPTKMGAGESVGMQQARFPEARPPCSREWGQSKMSDGALDLRGSKKQKDLAKELQLRRGAWNQWVFYLSSVLDIDNRCFM